MFAIPVPPVYTAGVLRRELYLFALYRLLEASLLALMVFSPVGALIGEPHNPLLAQAVCGAYLLASLALLQWARSSTAGLPEQALIGAGVDVVVATLAVHALPTAGPGVALMLLVNLGAASLFLPLRLGLFTACLAALAMLAEYVWSQVHQTGVERPLAEILMFTVSFFAMVTLTQQLGRRLRESQALAERRGQEAENLAGINELIIRRMRTGVLMIDDGRRVRMANEAAMRLFGEDEDRLEGRALAELSPELGARLERWLQGAALDDTPLLHGPEQLEIQPRFARLLTEGDTVLVFLDDASLVARRAESLTLSAMGRFSASLAHEIRNPLAAISYSVQLLEESPDLPESDRRLVQIIHQQCQRTNGIVESVLGLARRERAVTEQFDLVAFVRRFVDEFQQLVPTENGALRSAGRERPLQGMFDRRHLHQVLTVLVQNAINYGRMPGESARVTIAVAEREGRPAIEVNDRGPGIPEAVVPQLGRPFFTTSEHGTGLGLYIARELCRANGASLDYVAVPGGGACFRILMSGRNPLLS